MSELSELLSKLCSVNKTSTVSKFETKDMNMKSRNRLISPMSENIADRDYFSIKGIYALLFVEISNQLYT